MACHECHLSKVKCDHLTPCSRCLRLGKECSRHESNQGKKRPRVAGEDRPVDSRIIGTVFHSSRIDNANIRVKEEEYPSFVPSSSSGSSSSRSSVTRNPHKTPGGKNVSEDILIQNAINVNSG